MMFAPFFQRNPGACLNLRSTRVKVQTNPGPWVPKSRRKYILYKDILFLLVTEYYIIRIYSLPVLSSARPHVPGRVGTHRPRGKDTPKVCTLKPRRCNPVPVNNLRQKNSANIILHYSALFFFLTRP